MSASSSQVKENEAYNNFRQLYDKILDHHFKEDRNLEGAMNEAISLVIDSFRYADGGRFSNLDLSRLDILCAYVFRYGPHGAGLARCRVMEALENCRELEFLLNVHQLRVASLGGGPGNDAIGFCSAVSKRFSGILDVLVVDSAPSWGRFVHLSAKLLQQCDLGDASDLFRQQKVGQFNFTPLNLPQGIENLPVGEMDVFLICKLVSIMKWNDKPSLAWELYWRMKSSALILLIDSPFSEELWCDKFEVLYLSDARQSYQSGPSVEKFGHNDRVTSHARIAVLRKKSHVQQHSVPLPSLAYLPPGCEISCAAFPPPL